MNVQDMDFSTYPLHDIEGNILSRFWRIYYKTKEGFLKWWPISYAHQDERADIRSEEILRFESETRCQPLEIAIGLTFLQQEPNGPWLSLQEIKGFGNVPPSNNEFTSKTKTQDQAGGWVELDYTDKYYRKNGWRESAYSGRKDIFGWNKPKAPITESDMLKKQIDDLTKQLEVRKKNEDYMKDLMAQQAAGANVGSAKIAGS